MKNDIVQIEHLNITYQTEYGTVHAVNDISFSVPEGEITGLVGESGSGKSMTALSVMGLLPKGKKKVEGRILYRGQNVLEFSHASMRKLRNKEIGMIFQDPLSALNPMMTIGHQILECLNEHEKQLSGKEKKQRVIELLELLKIPGAGNCFRTYPHELSGGMRQRVMIAIAIVCNPRFLIADEPTTALDVTIQSQILKLLIELNEKRGTAVLLVSHDLAVIANTCRRIVVLYGGRVMETGTAEDIFYSAVHPYTRGLLQSVPSLGGDERLTPIEGTPIDGLHVREHTCPFYDRCSQAMNICRQQYPPETEMSESHKVYCWLLQKPGGVK